MQRSTKQRSILARERAKIRTFFNAEEFYARVRSIDPGIGIATIYRFLKEEVAEQRLYAYKCDRSTIYSKAKKSHCHFICERTGRVIHFEIDSLNFLKNKLPGSITSFQLEVRGICEKCGNDRH